MDAKNEFSSLLGYSPVGAMRRIEQKVFTTKAFDARGVRDNVRNGTASKNWMLSIPFVVSGANMHHVLLSDTVDLV